MSALHGVPARLVAGILVTLAIIPAAASATVRDRGSFQESYAYTEDCGFAVEVNGSFSVRYVLREGKNEDAGVFPVLERVRYEDRWTNAATGAWFVIRGSLTFNEVGATRVDGQIFEFRAVEAGQAFVVEDSSGRVVARDRGAIRVSYLFDTLGDSEPGGVFGEDTSFRVAGPHPSLDVEPCDYAADLIG